MPPFDLRKFHPATLKSLLQTLMDQIETTTVQSSRLSQTWYQRYYFTPTSLFDQKSNNGQLGVRAPEIQIANAMIFLLYIMMNGYPLEKIHEEYFQKDVLQEFYEEENLPLGNLSSFSPQDIWMYFKDFRTSTLFSGSDLSTSAKIYTVDTLRQELEKYLSK